MRKYISGYNTIDLTSNDVYTQALNACVLTNKKPTFIYDGSNVSIANTIVLNDDNTITINSELTIATNGTLTPSDWKIEKQHLGVLKLSYSDQDANFIVDLVNGIYPEFNDPLDETEKIDGLYSVLSAVKIIQVHYNYDDKDILIQASKSNDVFNITMKVNSSIVLQATVDAEDNITYTTNTDYFYIEYKQIF